MSEEMSDVWQILRDGGLPLAGERSPRIPSNTELAAATAQAMSEVGLAGRATEALAAFVFAWHQHWPQAFASAFGDHAQSAVEWAGKQFTDDGRYVKLRRIAIENLSQIL